MELFDTHAHYDDSRFDKDRGELLRSMQENGVKFIVNPGCDLPSTKKAIAMAEQYPFMFAAAGIHPEQARDVGEHALKELAALAEHPKVRAIGEIGLDYYWEKDCPREKQQEVFRWQMELAGKLGLPVIIHDRDAHADCLEIVRAYPQVTGVFHCYSGSLEMAKELVRLGYYLSFTGVITFKNAKKFQEIIRWLPDDRIMIETDCPYMAPEPFRGRRNSSLYVYRMAEQIAGIRGITAQQAAELTTQNGCRFFQIEH